MDDEKRVAYFSKVRESAARLASQTSGMLRELTDTARYVASLQRQLDVLAKSLDGTRRRLEQMETAARRTEDDIDLLRANTPNRPRGRYVKKMAQPASEPLSTSDENVGFDKNATGKPE